MAKDKNTDRLVAALTKRNREKIQTRYERLKEHESIDDILQYLADAKPKDREAFLLPWKTEKAAKGIGTNKTAKTFAEKAVLYREFVECKKMFEIEKKKKLSVRAVLELVIQKQTSKQIPHHERNKIIDAKRKKFKSYENMISEMAVFFAEVKSYPGNISGMA